MDSWKPFEIDELTGIIGQDAWINIRSEIEAHTFVTFTNVREAFFKVRIDYYKAQNWPAYKISCTKELAAYGELIRKEMVFGLNHCEVDLNNYIASSRTHLAKPEVKKACEMIDYQLRNKVDPRKTKDTREQLITMYNEHWSIEDAFIKKIKGASVTLTKDQG